MAATHTLIKALESTRKRLQKPTTYEVAKRSGLAPKTVRGIRNGLSLNPTIGVLITINKTLDDMGVADE